MFFSKLAVFALVSLPCAAAASSSSSIKNKEATGHLRHLSEVPLVKSVINCTAESPCEECQGDCKNENDCQGDLVCFKKEERPITVDEAKVPGCAGIDFSKTDWCVRPESMVSDSSTAGGSDGSTSSGSSGSTGSGSEGSCTVEATATQGVCDRPSSLRFLINSCGDVTGPTVVNRAMEASGQDISSYMDKETFSLAWSYMETLSLTTSSWSETMSTTTVSTLCFCKNASTCYASLKLSVNDLLCSNRQLGRR